MHDLPRYAAAVALADTDDTHALPVSLFVLVSNCDVQDEMLGQIEKVCALKQYGSWLEGLGRLFWFGQQIPLQRVRPLRDENEDRLFPLCLGGD